MGLERLVRGMQRRVGAALLGLATVAAPGLAADQYLTVVTKAQGVGGTQWRSEVVLQNPSLTETVHGELHLLPGDGDDRALPYTILPRGSLTIDDPVGQVGLTGNAAVRVTHEGETMPGVTARFWNEQDYDGDPSTTTQLSQYLQAQSIDAFLQPGDVAWLTGPDVTLHEGVEANRMNVFFVSAPGDDGVAASRYLVEAFNAGGELVTSTFLDVGERAQKTDFSRAVLRIDPHTGDTYRFTLLDGQGWFTASSPQNNQDLPGYDDAGSTTPTIERLVEEAYYLSAPATIEANDYTTAHIVLTSRPGTEIRWAVTDGAFQTRIDGNGTNELSWDYARAPTVPGTYENELSFLVKDERGAEYGRTLPPHTLTVEEARVDLPEDSFQITEDNIDQLANILGSNVNAVYLGTMKHYDEQTMHDIITAYVNGVDSPSDGELDHIEIHKADKAFMFALKGNANAVWGGLDVYQIEELRRIYNVD